MAIDQTDERWPRRAGVFTLAFVLALVPTTIFNWHSVDEYNRTRVSRLPGPLPRFAPVTSYGAFNFANANHERADGGFNWDLPALVPPDGEASNLLEQGQLDLARPPVYDAFVNGYRIGLRWLVSNPVAAARLFGKKLATALSAFDYGYLLDNVPVAIRGTRRPVDQVDLATSWVTWLHVALSLAGLSIALRNRIARLLLCPLLTLVVSTLLFFGYVRLGVAYLPTIWILQGLAIGAVLRRIPVRTLARAELAIAGLAAALLFYDYTRVAQARPLMIDGIVDETGRLVEDQPLTIERVR